MEGRIQQIEKCTYCGVPAIGTGVDVGTASAELATVLLAHYRNSCMLSPIKPYTSTPLNSTTSSTNNEKA